METFKNGAEGIKRITISDVADALQVSKTTVSRAISGKGRISDQTRKRVLAYIQKMDYQPSVIAKGLAEQKTYNLGMVIPGDCNLVDMPFFQNSMQGVCQKALTQDYDVMLAMTIGEDDSSLTRMIANHKIDGVILSRSVVEDKAVSLLKEKNIPFILMGSSEDREILQVDNNHEAACSQMIMGLLDSGIDKIGLIGGDNSFMVSKARMQGYRNAYAMRRRTVTEAWICENCTTTQKMEAAVFHLLQKGVECIVGMDDMICLQVLKVLEREQIQVPDRMKVASFYDSTLLSRHEPSISSLLFDDRILGEVTCAVLLDYIQGKEVQARTLLGYEIAYRKSTKG